MNGMLLKAQTSLSKKHEGVNGSCTRYSQIFSDLEKIIPQRERNMILLYNNIALCEAIFLSQNVAGALDFLHKALELSKKHPRHVYLHDVEYNIGLLQEYVPGKEVSVNFLTL